MPALSIYSAMPAQMGTSEVWQVCRHAPPSLCLCCKKKSLLLCKCPLLCWWIFAGWLQQQDLIEFPTVRLISSRHTQPPAQMHKNASVQPHMYEHNYKQKLHTNTCTHTKKNTDGDTQNNYQLKLGFPLRIQCNMVPFVSFVVKDCLSWRIRGHKTFCFITWPCTHTLCSACTFPPWTNEAQLPHVKSFLE